MILAKVADFIAGFEGFSSTVYPDTKGIPTVGYGFNLRRADAGLRFAAIGNNPTLEQVLAGAPITREQARRLMYADVERCIAEARRNVPSLDSMPEIARFIIVDLIYNMGTSGLFDNPQTPKIEGFPRFLRAMQAGRYALAALELIFRDLGKTDLTRYWGDTRSRAQHHASTLGLLALESFAAGRAGGGQ